MSFIPKGESEKTEEVINAEESASVNPKETKPKSSIMKSLILLVVIFVGLFLCRPYLTGEKEIAGFSDLGLGAGSGAQKADKDESNALIIPRQKDKQLRTLLEDFKEGFQKVHAPEQIELMEPEITRVRYSKDKKKLLLVLDYKGYKNTGTAGDSPAEERPLKQFTVDIVFDEDVFGRLVTEGTYKEIKLYPELPKK